MTQVGKVDILDPAIEQANAGAERLLRGRPKPDAGGFIREPGYPPISAAGLRRSVDQLERGYADAERRDQERHAAAMLALEAPAMLELIGDLWSFIENVGDDDPERQNKFFALRERVRGLSRPRS